ncbi:MAG: membrane protein [Nitrosomonas sp.]|nr:MAG: membrane protein [Nitrosomonas sp.]
MTDYFEESAARGAAYIEAKLAKKSHVNGKESENKVINLAGKTGLVIGATALPNETEVPCFRVFDSYIKSERMHAGVWFFEKDRDENITRTRVCSPLYVEAVTYDNQENNYGRLLRFKTTKGSWRAWAMPMEMLGGSGDELRRELMAMGVEIQPGNRPRNLLSVYLQSNPPRKEIKCALQVGWCDDSFVLPDKVYGEDGDNIIFQSGNRVHEEYTRKGTLDGWQEGVAQYAANNPMLMLAISVAFTGALLKKTNAESGGINLFGESSTGKSTGGIAAGSVWGGENYCRNWRTTANGLEGAAMLFNDGLLVLDELGECDAREVGNIVYALGNGKGKQRANRTGSAREVNRWRCFVLSTGEISISAKMFEAGQRSRPGQAVRLIDIPVNRQHGIFDELHGFHSGAELSDTIREEAGKNYGIAGRVFLENLTSRAENINERYRRTKESMAATIEGAEGQHKRVAARFALIALAGELATEYGITGWDDGEALAAAIEGYKAWCSTRGKGNDERRQILEQIADFIDRYGDSKFSRVHDSSVIINDRAGWYEDGTEGRVYLFTKSGLREALKGCDFKRSLDLLVNLGALPEPSENGERAQNRRIDGRQTKVYQINSEKILQVTQNQT